MATPHSDTASTAAGRSPRIAYLLSRYPAVSHTFLLAEVLGLRKRGFVIEVASINSPDRPVTALPEVEKSEALSTFYVKAGGMLAKLSSLLGILIRHPAVFMRGLRGALSMGGWDLREHAFAFFYLAEALLVGEWMRRRSLTHLHVHFAGPVASVGLLVGIAWSIPWSLAVHGPDEFFDQERFLLCQKFAAALFLVCISDYGRSQVLRIAASLRPSRVEVIRLGVDRVALPHPSSAARLPP